MASEIKANKISPATGTAFTIGDSGDTFTIPSGVTLTNNGTASGFGKVLQVVSATYSTEATTTSNTWTSTGLTASITPSSTSNKVLVLMELPMAQRTTANAVRAANGTLFRGASTNLGDSDDGMGKIYTGIQNGDFAGGNIGACYLDSPSSTSSVSYTAYFKSFLGDTAYAFPSNAMGTLTLMEIAG